MHGLVKNVLTKNVPVGGMNSRMKHSPARVLLFFAKLQKLYSNPTIKKVVKQEDLQVRETLFTSNLNPTTNQ
jgi:hypothetical protein